MLRRAWFRSYKLLGDVTLELGRLNVIVGRNGVGKSTVLDGIDAVLRLTHPQVIPDRVKAVFRDSLEPRKLMSRGPRKGELAIGVSSRDVELAVELRPLSEVADDFSVRVVGGLGVEATLERSALNADLEFEELMVLEALDTDTLGTLLAKHQLSPATVANLRLDARRTSATTEVNVSGHGVLGDGGGLAGVLQHLHALRDGALDAIEADLRKVIPQARRLRALPAMLRKLEQVHVRVDGQQSLVDRWVDVTGARWELEMEGLGWVPAEQLSEGTLLATALITVLHHQSPRLLLIDDLDKGLHPVAQKDAIKVLRAVLEANPELQIIATSHSPFVLDELDASEVFVAGAISPTATAIRRLDLHPAWEQRKNYLHPGEFWSVIGEDWVGGVTS